MDNSEGNASRIALHQFRALSSKREDQTFSRGLTTKLAGAMREVIRIRMMETSLVKRTGSNKSLGEQVVSALVAGKVRRAGERRRISVQLINVRDHSLMWSAIFERPVGDSPLLQEELARAIAERVSDCALPDLVLEPPRPKRVTVGQQFSFIYTCSA